MFIEDTNDPYTYVLDWIYALRDANDEEFEFVICVLGDIELL